PRSTDLVGLTKDIAGLFSLHATERHLDYTISSPHTELNALVDTDKFEKIVFNLISNAFKYTPDGGSITITIRYSTTGTQPAAELHVRDTGIGIAPDLRDKVFDLFYQVQGSRRYESASTGIGLALARQLAELHGGTLTVTSEEGAGSDFILTLPINEPIQHSAPPQPTTASPQNPAVPGLPPHTAGPQTPPAAEPRATAPVQTQTSPIATMPTASEPTQDLDADLESDTPLILLVEDNAHLRDYIRGELPPIYRTAVAGDGAAGLEKALQLIPDLIISDVMMPNLSGLELCRAVKTDQRTSHIPVILLTARQSDAHQVEGYSAGADVYIPKPFNMEVITACVSSLLESRRRMRELYRKHTLPREEQHAMQLNFLDRQFLENAATIVDRHLADPLFDVEGLAARLKVSRRQLYRKLNALTGETPHDYITTRRLTKAAQLLLTGELTVSEVAYKTGFTDAANFSRSFTRHHGRSPSKYRKDAR